MKAEREASEFYRTAQKDLTNEKTRRLLFYLASMEDSHYYLLKVEYDLLNTFADYESYKRFSLEHLGP